MTAFTGMKNSKRGFAGMSAERRQEIAAMGGRAAHENGTAHQWSREEASAAGRIGGKVSRKKPKVELQ